MFVRTISENEILPALHLVWEVYVSDVAPLLKPEAVAGFQQFIRYENIAPRIRGGEITLFGAFEGRELCGVSGIDRRGNILLLYIRKNWQRRGVGRQLMQAMYQYCAQVLVITRMMMRVFPSAATAMNHLGLRDTAPVQTVGPEVFIPMELMIAPGAMPPRREKKNTAVIVGAVVLVLAFLGLLAKMVYNEARDVFQNPYPFDSFGDYGDYDGYGDYGDWFGDDYFDEGEGSLSGIDAIPEYEEKGLPFEIKEENYLDTPDDKKTTYVDFEISYPQIEGLKDESVQDKINEELRVCAMETVDRIYENPDSEVKERVLGEEYPVIADYVKYKVTYLTEEYLCVVFEDYSYEGSEEAYYVGLRAKNVNLKDGTAYEVKDIVDLKDDFVEEWLEGMKSESDSEEILSELDETQMRKALSGEDTKDGTYLPVFFADKEGVEIGFSFHYDKDDEDDLGYGWVTAPFDDEEIGEFQSENPFWDLIK